jgi:hypothetical protein
MAEEFLIERAMKKVENSGDESEKYSSFCSGKRLRGTAAAASEILPCRGLPESSAAQRVSRGDLLGFASQPSFGP